MSWCGVFAEDRIGVDEICKTKILRSDKEMQHTSYVVASITVYEAQGDT